MRLSSKNQNDKLFSQLVHKCTISLECTIIFRIHNERVREDSHRHMPLNTHEQEWQVKQKQINCIILARISQ